MRLFRNIYDKCVAMKVRRSMSRTAKRQSYLEKLSCQALNILEFDGRLYIAHNGVPIVRVENLNMEAPEILAQSRKDYLAWGDKFDRS